MLKLKPDLFALSLEDIPVLELKDKGIEGLIIDLDNTLTNWNCHHIEPHICKWLQNLTQLGFKTCILSNNGVNRIKASVQQLNIPFIGNALKPSKRGFLKAMAIMETEPQNTAIIGDQLFTDILGGKRVGITTILVPPRSRKEFIGTKITRLLEKAVLKSMDSR